MALDELESFAIFRCLDDWPLLFLFASALKSFTRFFATQLKNLLTNRSRKSCPLVHMLEHANILSKETWETARFIILLNNVLCHWIFRKEPMISFDDLISSYTRQQWMVNMNVKSDGLARPPRSIMLKNVFA